MAAARKIQMTRNEGLTNAELRTDKLDKVSQLDDEGQKLLLNAADILGLTARGYHRVLRVARTLADLAFSDNIHRVHIAESLSFRRQNSRISSDKTQKYDTSCFEKGQF